MMFSAAMSGGGLERRPRHAFQAARRPETSVGNLGEFRVITPQVDGQVLPDCDAPPLSLSRNRGLCHDVRASIQTSQRRPKGADRL